jgi:hypothetical protein
MNSSVMFWGFLFSTFGLGFFSYGRKQRAIVPLACGLILMVYPFFVTNLPLLIGAGIVLTIIPWFVRY